MPSYEPFPTITDDQLPLPLPKDGLAQPFCGLPDLDGNRPVIVELLRPENGQPAGARGKIESFMGYSLYDLHVEVPINGCGVPFDSVVVLERAEDGSLVRTPYWEWIAHVGAKVRCNRCRKQLIAVHDRECSWQVERDAQNAELRRQDNDLKARRKAFAAKSAPMLLAVQADKERGAIELHFSDLETIKLRAAEYAYDFIGLHLVSSDGKLFYLYATGRRPGVASSEVHIPVLE